MNSYFCFPSTYVLILQSINFRYFSQVLPPKENFSKIMIYEIHFHEWYIISNLRDEQDIKFLIYIFHVLSKYMNINSFFPNSTCILYKATDVIYWLYQFKINLVWYKVLSCEFLVHFIEIWIEFMDILWSFRMKIMHGVLGITV